MAEYLYTLYQHPRWLLGILLIYILWTIIWTGLALWSAARNKHKGWFISLLLFNALGILPIIYLFAFRPRHAPDHAWKQATLLATKESLRQNKEKARRRRR